VELIVNVNEKSGSGSLPFVKNDRDGLAIDMKLQGKPNQEIADATGISLGTVQNILTKGGRLYPILESLRSQKALVLREDNLSTWQKLLASKDPAVEELRRIAREDPNTAARLKAIDMILELTGVRDGEKPPFLDSADRDKSSERFTEWANEYLLKAFRDEAPVLLLRNRVEWSSEREWLETVIYMNHKHDLWRYDEEGNEDVFKKLDEEGYDVKEMEARLARYGVSSEPWKMYRDDPQEATAYKECVDAIFLRRSRCLRKLFGYIKRYAHHLAHCAVIFKHESSLHELRKCLANAYGMTSKEVDDLFNGLFKIAKERLHGQNI